MNKFILLAATTFFLVQHVASIAHAADKWVVTEGPKFEQQHNALPKSAVIDTDAADGIRLYNFNSRRLVTSLPRTTEFNVVGQNKSWVYVTIKGYPVWVHTNYVERKQGEVEVKIQEGKLNLRKEPDKYAMTLGTSVNGYRSVELDFKDPWVQIIAPDNLQFAIKKSDFDTLQGSHNSELVYQEQKSVVAKNSNKKIDKSSDINETKLPDNIKQQSSIKSRPKDNKPTQVTKTGKNITPITSNKKVPVKNSKSDIEPAKEIVVQKRPEVVTSNNRIPYTDALIYRLTPGDVISVQIYGESELGINQVRIPEGGVISFPLIGQIKVAGKTAVAVENLVTRKLADGYIRNPKVSLVIDNYRPIYIRGAVTNSGAFPYAEGLTIAKAITLAGGATKAADFNGVSLVRRNVALEEKLTVDSQTLVQPGDILSIAEEIGAVSSSTVESVYLHGEVKSPGGYDYRKGLTVEKAIALAGGFSIRASKKRINISRHAPGQEEPLKIKKVDLYFPVQPGDVISVGASWF